MGENSWRPVESRQTTDSSRFAEALVQCVQVIHRESEVAMMAGNRAVAVCWCPLFCWILFQNLVSGSENGMCRIVVNSLLVLNTL